MELVNFNIKNHLHILQFIRYTIGFMSKYIRKLSTNVYNVTPKNNM